MKQIDKMKDRWKGFIDTVLRFPFTIVMLVAAVITNAIAINLQSDDNLIRLLVSFILGASLYAVFQMIYERFLNKPSTRIIFMVVSIILSFVYYFLIRNTNWDIAVNIRTAVIFFILLIAFHWVPVIKSKINFNESFIAGFKGFFVAAFFSGVLYLGVMLIIGATDILITPVDQKAYMHAANIIFMLFAPIYFLSLIPFYPGKQTMKSQQDLNIGNDNMDSRGIKDNNDIQESKNIKDSREIQANRNDSANQELLEVLVPAYEDNDSLQDQSKREEALVKFTSPSRFLETLISYVIIPITAVLTIILLLYIIINITGDFWSDNLLEPLLVSYSITVIIVYLLTSTLKNAFATYFRKIFPKVLVPVVLFQTLASVLRIGDLGVTYGRYYVIMFGVFATIAGILFCIVPVNKNGLIAPILIALSVISILPPVDSFTISKANQIGRLENALERNEMLVGDTITPKVNLSEEDQQIIVTSVNYLNNMGYTEDIKWLSTYNVRLDFEETFGFTEYEKSDENYQNFYLNRNMNEPIPIAGYDYMVRMNDFQKDGNIEINSFELEGKSYSLSLDNSDVLNQAIILEEVGQPELIRFELKEIFNKFTATNTEKTLFSTEEVTFTQDNSAATITIIAESISVSEWLDGRDQSADFYVFIDIK